MVLFNRSNLWWYPSTSHVLLKISATRNLPFPNTSISLTAICSIQTHKPSKFRGKLPKYQLLWYFPFLFFFNQPTTWQINGIQIFLSVAQGLQGGWVVLSGSTVSAIPNHLLHLRLSLFCLDISLPFGCFSILPKLSNVSTLYLLLQKAFSYTCNTVLFRCRSFRSVCKTRSAEFLGRNRRNLDQTPSITHPLLY